MKARTLFAVLLLLNVALGAGFAWTQLRPAAPAPVAPEYQASRIQLEHEAPASAAQALPAVVEPAKETIAAEEPPPVASAPPASAVVVASAAQASEAPASAPAERLICLRWGDFTTAQWREARSALRLQLATLEIEEFLDEDKARYWVYLPPFDSQQAARQAVADLKSRGVADSFIIQEPGPQQFAVSLGLFSKKSMADELVSRLKSRGIERIISRPHPQSRYISIVLRDLPESQRGTIRTLAARFEKTTVQNQPCPR